MLSISYAITVCNEVEEFKRLVESLIPVLQERDEIVVLVDKPKVSEDFQKYLYELGCGYLVHVVWSEFKEDFAEWKNKLNSYCKGDWIFQIDADEEISPHLLNKLRRMLSDVNSELIYVPRLNTVEGLTRKDIRRWQWHIDSGGRINWPDYQGRLYRNVYPRIRWEGKVHEKIIGAGTYSILPADELYCIIHRKSIERQKKQNELYKTLMR